MRCLLEKKRLLLVVVPQRDRNCQLVTEPTLKTTKQRETMSSSNPDVTGKGKCVFRKDLLLELKI